MYPHLSPDEQEALVRRYQQLPGDQAVEILDSPQAVQLNGGPPQVFAIDEEIFFTRPNTNMPGQKIEAEGTIGLFIRPLFQGLSPSVWVVLHTEKGRWYRVPITDLSKTPTQVSSDRYEKKP